MNRSSGQLLKHAVKVALAHLLYGVGLLQAWQRYIMRRRAVVLMYHRVLTDQEWRATGSHPGMCVTTATFERHMAVVRRRFAPLQLETFASHLLHRQPFPASSCLITFDDGWRDTMVNALPVLRRQQLPVTIFLPVNFVGSRRLFAREAFAHLVMHARSRAAAEPAVAPRLREVLAGAGLEDLLDLSGPDVRARIIASIGDAPVTASIEGLVQDLARELGIEVERLETPDTFMTWSDVSAIEQADTAFGGHGANHRRLAAIPAEQASEEIRTSKTVLEKRTHPPVWAFSYPNGSCNRSVAEAVHANGYQVAFTTEAGLVDCHDDPLLVRRVNIHEDATPSAPMFLARVVGLF